MNSNNKAQDREESAEELLHKAWRAEAESMKHSVRGVYRFMLQTSTSTMKLILEPGSGKVNDSSHVIAAFNTILALVWLADVVGTDAEKKDMDGLLKYICERMGTENAGDLAFPNHRTPLNLLKKINDPTLVLSKEDEDYFRRNTKR